MDMTKFIASLVLLLLALPASASAQNSKEGSSNQSAATNRTIISVLDYGADPTGVSDSTVAFNAAVKAAANIVAPGGDGSNTNTCVVVPPTQGGNTGYLLSGTINLPNMCLKSIDGLVWIRFIPRDNNTDLFNLYAPYNSDTGSNGSELAGFQIVHPGAVKGRDDIRISSGNHGHVHNIISTGAGRDCFHAEPGGSNGWIESLHVEDVTCWHAGRDSFNFTVPDGMKEVFITQTTMHNNTSRLVGRSAVTLDSENQQPGNYKISSWAWIGGEIDCSFGSSPNCVDLIQASNSNGQPLEDINFVNVAIEDSVRGVHSGYAVGVTKKGTASVGPVNMIGVIPYGEARGDLDTSQLDSWYRDCTAENTTCDHGFSRLQVQTEAGLSFVNQAPHTGSNTVTFMNSPCAAGNPQDWLAVPLNGTTYYIPACHP
jgi:hypothetical protein